MTLINTDGMSFIGPGSEWFWTAVSGIVLAVTFIAIYRQLRLQSSQAAIEQLNKIEQEYNSERLDRHKLKLYLLLRDGVDPADLPQHASVSLINFWERVGSLARQGHLDLELLWDGGSGFYCQSDWVRLAPSLLKARVEEQNPQLGEYFEWLTGQMEAKGRRLGIRLDDAAAQAARLDRSITGVEASIRVEEALRAVTMVAPVAAPVAPPAVAVASQG